MIILLFLEKEIDIEIKNYKRTALHTTIYERYTTMIGLLLEKIADINIKDAKGEQRCMKRLPKNIRK
jgi:ankyrin repeat protein